MMGEMASREELEKAMRLSRRALPFGILFAVIGCGIMWGIYRSLQRPHWFIVSLPVIAVPVGQAVNIFRCRRALRRLGSSPS
jgi:hypothetical protein